MKSAPVNTDMFPGDLPPLEAPTGATKVRVSVTLSLDNYKQLGALAYYGRKPMSDYLLQGLDLIYQGHGLPTKHAPAAGRNGENNSEKNAGAFVEGAWAIMAMMAKGRQKPSKKTSRK